MDDRGSRHRTYETCSFYWLTLVPSRFALPAWDATVRPRKDFKVRTKLLATRCVHPIGFLVNFTNACEGCEMSVRNEHQTSSNAPLWSSWSATRVVSTTKLLAFAAPRKGR